MAEKKEPQPLDHTFTGVINADDDWHVVEMPDSKEFFGTGRTVKVVALVDGAETTTSFMPTGKGNHMLPLNAKVRKEIGKGAGDEVTIQLKQRL